MGFIYIKEVLRVASCNSRSRLRAETYGVNKKVILDRINDGCTLKDGFTTLDWYSPEDETVEELREMRQYIPKADFLDLD